MLHGLGPRWLNICSAFQSEDRSWQVISSGITEHSARARTHVWLEYNLPREMQSKPVGWTSLWTAAITNVTVLFYWKDHFFVIAILNIYRLSSQSCTAGSVLQVNQSSCSQTWRQYISQRSVCRRSNSLALAPVAVCAVNCTVQLCPWMPWCPVLIGQSLYLPNGKSQSCTLDNTPLVDILGFQRERF